SMWSALQAVQKEMGGATALDLKFSENMYNVPDAAAAVRDYASQGFDIVIAVLAAKLTKSKKIGVTGPVEVGDAKTYIDGFLQGVQSVDKSITISKTWTGSFSDVALMTAAAKTHIASGADVLTGSSQSVVGSIGAAKDAGAVLWFGTQADQASLAPSLVVASQVYDWTGMLKDILAKRKAGVLGG